MNDPIFLDSLISSFETLPGVGKKTAKRYAYSVIEKLTEEEVENFATNLLDAKKKIKHCDVCGMLSMNNPCEFCSSKTIDRTKIMVLKDTKDILTINEIGEYKGLYHSLNGLISLSNGIGPDDINVTSLLNRITDKVSEVILAMPFTQDGETTALFIEKLLSKYNVTVSRLGYGLPAGGDIEYIDELTLRRAIENRVSNK